MMPKNTLIFFRHAETKIDESLVISKWILTKKGKKDAEVALSQDYFNDVDIIIASSEQKAFQTALSLSYAHDIKIIRNKDLNELQRDQGTFFDNREIYYKTLKDAFTNRNISYNNWETTQHALDRFSDAILQIDLNYLNKKILLISHGIVINLYFSKIFNNLDESYERWTTNTFCDYGIIKNNLIVKDIAKK